MNQKETLEYLKDKRSKFNKKNAENETNRYYIFPDDVREKFKQIIGIEPDFALIPKSTSEKGGKRTFNSGEYVLYQVQDGVAKVIKKDGTHRNKSNKVDWDTPEVRFLFEKIQ